MNILPTFQSPIQALQGMPGAKSLGIALRNALVIKVATVPANLAAGVGIRVTYPDPVGRDLLLRAIQDRGVIQTLRSAQILADCFGSQKIYRGLTTQATLTNQVTPDALQDLTPTPLQIPDQPDPAFYQVAVNGQAVAVIQDRNSIGDLGNLIAGAGLGQGLNSTVTRFWATLQEYLSVLGRFKRRLSTVVVYQEKGLKRTLADHDDPDDYLSEISGQLYQALGDTGVLVIDDEASASVLNLDISGIDKAVTPWKHMVLASAGGLTEDQLWGGSDRPVGLSGADEQSRRSVAAMVNGITESWSPFLLFAAQEIALELGLIWQDVGAEFNPYDNSSLIETLTAQKLASEADQIAIDRGVLTPEEVRSSRHGGDGFGANILLANEGDLTPDLTPNLTPNQPTNQPTN